MKVMKMIASLVISASLGGFSAVQSFLHNKAVASTIRHLVHDANPALVYCKGDVASCNKWMGCTCAPVHINPFGVDRSSSARGSTSKNASPSPDDSSSPEPINSIWVQLYIDNVEAGGSTQVKVERGANVDDLAKLVKKEYNEKLVGITAADLMVYEWSDKQYTSPLRRDIQIDRSSYGGDSLDRPIRVRAYTPNQQFAPKISESREVVWVQLYIDNVEVGGVVKVKLELGADVSDLANEVKKVYSDKLVGISPGELMVYAQSDDQYTSPLRGDIKIDRSSYGGDSLDRPIRVTAKTPNQVVLPPDVKKWGVTSDDKSIDFSDFSKAARDVFYNFVDPNTKNIIGAGETWGQSSDLEDFAASLVGHHGLMEELLAEVDVKEDVLYTRSGCSARYLGAGVIALELPRNPIEAEDTKVLATVLSRSNVRSIVKETIDALRSGDSVFVIGQPGIGKTRSCLLGCLALLLSEGAPVLYLSKKTSRAYLFIPNPDQGGRYLVWINEDYVTSRLTGDARMIVLMDPPEEAGYKWQFTARLVKVCSNNQEKHFQNADKLTQVRFLYPDMPKLEEVFAMAKVLWKDPLSHFPGKVCKDKSEMWNILAMRSFLVGCAPRYIFDFAKYDARLQAIRTSTEEQSRKQVKTALFRIANEVEFIRNPQNLASVSSKLYDLDGADIVGKVALPRVTLNVYARNCLLRQLTGERMSAAEFELLVEEYLLLGGKFKMKKFTFDYPMPDELTDKAETEGLAEKAETANLAKNAESGKKGGNSDKKDNKTGKKSSKSTKKANEDVTLSPTTEIVDLPHREKFAPANENKMGATDFVRQTIQKLPQGYVYSTRDVQNFRVIDFATSPSEWWNAKSGQSTVPRVEMELLLKEMEAQRLKKVTITNVAYGTLSDMISWPFVGTSKGMTEAKWGELKDVTVRFWYLDMPSDTVEVPLLVGQCNNGVFDASLSQDLSLKERSDLVFTVEAATTNTSVYERLSAALTKAKNSGS